MKPATKVASPCIGVCALDVDSGLCQGCLRSAEEIAAWRDASDAERRAIIKRTEARRRAAASAERSGHQRRHRTAGNG